MEFNELIDTIREYSTAAFDKASELGKMAASKTDTAVKKAKIKYGIAEIESKRRDIYTVIGEKMYEVYKSGSGDTDFTEEYSALDELTDELDELEGKLADYRDAVKCKNCGKYTDSENEYCPKCGEKLEKKTAEPEETAEEDDAVIEVESVSAESGEDIAG